MSAPCESTPVPERLQATPLSMSWALYGSGEVGVKATISVASPGVVVLLLPVVAAGTVSVDPAGISSKAPAGRTMVTSVGVGSGLVKVICRASCWLRTTSPKLMLRGLKVTAMDRDLRGGRCWA
ncbi:MAG: hypothetical protein QM820_46890 [Minicystis sp.]